MVYQKLLDAIDQNRQLSSITKLMHLKTSKAGIAHRCFPLINYNLSHQMSYSFENLFLEINAGGEFILKFLNFIDHLSSNDQLEIALISFTARMFLFSSFLNLQPRVTILVFLT
jgi:hypothetical protein